MFTLERDLKFKKEKFHDELSNMQAHLKKILKKVEKQKSKF